MWNFECIIRTPFFNGVRASRESVRMEGWKIFPDNGGSQRMGKLIEIDRDGFLSKDLTKILTEDLVSQSPNNRYPMQVYLGAYANRQV